MTDEEVQEALKIAKMVLGQQKKSNRITITKNDRDAFWFLWGIYMNAIEAGDGEHFSQEDQDNVSKLRKKIIG